MDAYIPAFVPVPFPRINSACEPEVGAESKGVRWSRKASRRIGIETEGLWAESDERRERKSLRNEVHNANGVVWGPV
jgi:hypothetical protein